MTSSKQETFSIGDTARMTGVSQKQLRHWEARGYISAPMRIVCGQRAYRYFNGARAGGADPVHEKPAGRRIRPRQCQPSGQKIMRKGGLINGQSPMYREIGRGFFWQCPVQHQDFRQPRYPLVCPGREPDNLHDPNAIRVALFGEFFMGYIPKDVAVTLAPLMDAGSEFDAEFICVDKASTA